MRVTANIVPPLIETFKKMVRGRFAAPYLNIAGECENSTL